MKNIIEILSDIGVTIPDDKKQEFNKAVSDNYKTVAEFDKKISGIEAERDNYKTQAESAASTLEKFKDVDVDAIKKDLAEWQNKANSQKAEFDKQIAERDFADALRSEIEAYKFSSESAKKSIISAVKETGLTLKDGKILGLADRIAQIKESDPGAFVEDNNNGTKAKFTEKQHQQSNGKSYTSADLMKMANADPNFDYRAYIKTGKE